MDIIDYYPNLERAITPIECITITNKEFRQLKKISRLIRENIETNINDQITPYTFIKYYIEKSIRDSKLEIFSKAKKEIIIANILLPDDIEIAEILNNNGFTKESLKELIRFRALIKNLVLNNSKIDINLENKFNDYKETINTIVLLFNEKFQIKDQTTILNRICELLVSNPNYFENKYINTKTR